MADFRLETDRLILRDWRADDWAPFWRDTNTEPVMRWLGGVMDQPKRDAAQGRLLAYAAEHGHTFWAIERKADHAVVGFCGLKRSNQAGGPQGEFEVGWRLREADWGQGYAREAAAASLDHAFAVLAAPQVIALTVQGNSGSWGLMERLGMERRAYLDFANADFDSETGRIIVYAISADQWRHRA